jgi:AcrR family transcriptional regulator
MMVHPRSRSRAYSSSLRAEQQELTRGRIMRAVADLIREGQIHSFTVEEVSQRAGVSYGSVYRHFPSRERLLEEAYEWFQSRGDAPSPPESLDAIPAWGEALFAHFEANADVVQAAAMAMSGMGLTPRAQRERDDRLQRLVSEAVPGLDGSQVRVKAALIRYLASSLAWATLRQRFGLTPGEVTVGVSWALQALLQALKRELASDETSRQDIETSRQDILHSKEV